MTAHTTRLCCFLAALLLGAFFFSNAYATAYKDPRHGFTLVSPPNWSFVMPTEVEKRVGGLLVVVNDADPDENADVRFMGKALRGEADTIKDARRLLKRYKFHMPEVLRNENPEVQISSSRIFDLAGGAALETVIVFPQGATQTKQKSIMLIVDSKVFMITFSARAETFDKADEAAFRPILGSFTFN